MKIIILPGPPKTGSTYLQNFLVENVDELRRSGFHWPPCYGLRGEDQYESDGLVQFTDALFEAIPHCMRKVYGGHLLAREVPRNHTVAGGKAARAVHNCDGSCVHSYFKAGLPQGGERLLPGEGLVRHYRDFVRTRIGEGEAGTPSGPRREGGIIFSSEYFYSRLVVRPSAFLDRFLTFLEGAATSSEWDLEKHPLEFVLYRRPHRDHVRSLHSQRVRKKTETGDFGTSDPRHHIMGILPFLCTDFKKRGLFTNPLEIAHRILTAAELMDRKVNVTIVDHAGVREALGGHKTDMADVFICDVLGLADGAAAPGAPDRCTAERRMPPTFVTPPPAADNGTPRSFQKKYQDLPVAVEEEMDRVFAGIDCSYAYLARHESVRLLYSSRLFEGCAQEDGSKEASGGGGGVKALPYRSGYDQIQAISCKLAHMDVPDDSGSQFDETLEKTYRASWKVPPAAEPHNKVPAFPNAAEKDAADITDSYLFRISNSVPQQHSISAPSHYFKSGFVRSYLFSLVLVLFVRYRIIQRKRGKIQ